MALRGTNWFLGRCYDEVINRTRLTNLCDKSLRLAFGKESTQGHIFQACGAIQKFLESYPQHKVNIRNADSTRPFALQGEILDDWLKFFRHKRGGFGRRSYGYNWDILRGYLPPRYGGIRRGGGGGKNEFEIVLRLMAEFM